MFSLLYRDTLDPTTADELDRLTSDLSTVFEVEHFEDGTHNFAPSFALVPVGGVIVWPVSAAPPGWVFTDGSAVNRVTYVELFRTIGITFGAGDGSTTFNVPSYNGGALTYIIYGGL